MVPSGGSSSGLAATAPPAATARITAPPITRRRSTGFFHEPGLTVSEMIVDRAPARRPLSKRQVSQATDSTA